MATSQCVEDSPRNGPNNQEVYNEQHRLALEELVSGGIERFAEFLRKERIPNFLSEDELRGLVRAAAALPRCASLLADDLLEHTVSSSVNCSSVTYFPEISDLEPPLLEIGWPAFTAGSYRGVTRAVAHFQPSYGECIYSCKEAARRMIKSAREVIAIVTDSLTDLDVVKDLHEACTSRNVPVYILLDQTSAAAFLNMCSNVGIRPDDLQHMRVRTLRGSTYYMRSGARITGKVHERFMLIDGNRVATGSYRFNWTDGRLNSSNLIELSGQITENFDEEFRILYAQSQPINTQVPPMLHDSGIHKRLHLKPGLTSSPYRAQVRPVETLCLTSTPGPGPQAPAPEVGPPCAPLAAEGSCKSSPVSNSSTLGDELDAEILAEAPTGTLKPPRDAATQTCCFTADNNSQTDSENGTQCQGPRHCDVAPTTTGAVTSTSRDQAAPPSPAGRGQAAPESNLRDCIQKLPNEQQNHYSTIRAKLEHMVSILSQRRELADLTNMATLQGQNAALPAESTGMWPRVRCVH